MRIRELVVRLVRFFRPWTHDRIESLEDQNRELVQSWIDEIRARNNDLERYAQNEHKFGELRLRAAIQTTQIKEQAVRIDWLTAQTKTLADDNEQLEQDLIAAQTEIMEITSRYNVALSGYLKAFVEFKDEIVALKEKNVVLAKMVEEWKESV